jgi:hypothetical protein
MTLQYLHGDETEPVPRSAWLQNLEINMLSWMTACKDRTLNVSSQTLNKKPKA